MANFHTSAASLLLFVSMTVFAQPVEVSLLTPEEVKTGKDALARFNRSTKYVNRHPDQEALYVAVQERCEIDDATGCLKHLVTQRHDVLRALPDNPAY